VAAGDPAALRTLYDDHAPRAMAIALRILQRPQEAEDVVQDTFLEIWRRARPFEGARGGAAAWVVSIARRQAIDRLRASRAAVAAPDGTAGAEDLVPTVQLSLAGQTEGQRDQTRVPAALAALPAEQRETIEHAYFDGLSQAEIAAQTGTPLGVVKMRMNLAMKRLTELLGEDEE
jgi:RNA polymerase sigma-70 factor (ECF subfamily)